MTEDFLDIDFLEIGTSDFDTLIEKSDFYSIGICVEPLKHYLYKLPFRPNVKKINKAISFDNSENQIEIFYIPEEEIIKHNLPLWLKGCNTIGDYHPQHINLKIQNLVKIEKIEQIPISKLLTDNKIRKIKHLKIDVEGGDCKILQNLYSYLKTKPPDFLPEKITFEDNSLSNSNEIENVKKLYIEIGYKKLTLSPDDTTLIYNNPNTLKNSTLVTGLWDINRNSLEGMWKRPFSSYLENFLELLKTDNNLIIFGDKDLEKITFKYRSKSNTKFIVKDINWFKNNNYFNLIQKIRNNPEWLYQTDWLKNSPQGSLEMYNPIIMSKMFLLQEATHINPFNSDYFYWIDGGNRIDKKFYFNNIIENISKYTNFFFICFPHIPYNEIHGFNYEELKNITLCNINIVARGGFFGGNKDLISTITPIYHNLMIETLEKNLMGTEESLFTILTYTCPELIDYFELNSEDFADPQKFFEKFIHSDNKKNLFNKIKINKRDFIL